AAKFVGTGIGGAIGSGAFFATATPTLAVAGSTLRDNQALGGSNVVVANQVRTDTGSGRGGAILAFAGDVALSDTTVRDNLAEGGALFRVVQSGSITSVRGSSAFGGGIDHEFNFTFSTPPAFPALSITASPIRGNVARGTGPGASAVGGGVQARSVNAQLARSTVSDNQGVGGAGSVVTVPGRVFSLAGGGASGGGVSFSNRGGSLTIGDS